MSKKIAPASLLSMSNSEFDAAKPKPRTRKAKAKPVFSVGQLRAYRAHRTMWSDKLANATKSGRAAIMDKIAHYDALIASAA